MSKKTKIAIIIPIYNEEKYLKECLDSIKNQTYKNFLCICINDGSADNSEQIINEYKKKDKRFMLINQKNQGSAKARNTGIQKVLKLKIPFIAFIDCDDFVSEKFLEFLYKGITSGNYNICEVNRIKFDKTNYNNIRFDEKELLSDNQNFNQDIFTIGLVTLLFNSSLFKVLTLNDYKNIEKQKSIGDDALLYYFINKKNIINKVFYKNCLYANRNRKSSVSKIDNKVDYVHLEKLFNYTSKSEKDLIIYLATLLTAIHNSILLKQKIPKPVKNKIKQLIAKIERSNYSKNQLKFGDKDFVLKKRVKLIKVFGINFYILLKKIIHNIKLIRNQKYKDTIDRKYFFE